MKKTFLLLAVIGFSLSFLLPTVSSQNSQDSTVDVDVENQCDIGIYEYEQPGSGEVDPKIIGKGETGYFSGTVSNTGNQNITANVSINIYRSENGTYNEINLNETSQPGNFSFQEEIPYQTKDENTTDFAEFLTEYNATQDPGNYTGEVSVDYRCQQGRNGTTAKNRTFAIIEALGVGEGNQPDDIGQDNEVDLELDTDAVIEALNQSADLDTNTTELENASLDLDALIEQLNRTGQVDTDVNRTENASLETDADETAEDSTPQEGDNDSPGQTPEPEPEPEPEPDPIPLLSVDIKPQNSTYTTAKGRFAEIGLNITNTGEEALNNLQLEPRFSEDMDWQAQDSTIDSLGVDETVNQSVYVNAGESVESGIYQIPVYASNDQNDIDSQYVNVEVTEEVFTSALNIGEAPRDIQFEAGQNYSVPVLLENDGDSSLEDVQVELQNSENCGEYSSETVEEVPASESSSININFETSSELNECEATLVASTDSGEFAFSDMDIENVEDVGVVPQQFRFPIVASMWTLMLMAYAVLTKRYGVHNLTVKVPLVLLVVGEALILIYLSSVYYNVLPPGLLPFS